MLSLKRCREILGRDNALSDEDLVNLRNELYSLAVIVVSAADPHSPSSHDSDSSDENQLHRNPPATRQSKSASK